jgi:hypothetical protein
MLPALRPALFAFCLSVAPAGAEVATKICINPAAEAKAAGTALRPGLAREPGLFDRRVKTLPQSVWGESPAQPQRIGADDSGSTRPRRLDGPMSLPASAFLCPVS